MEQNTTHIISTHFLRGVEVIEHARKDFSVSSENWAYPYYKYGDVENDEYYAEIWTDGMDWNTVYWLIESHWKYFPKPQAIPFMIIDHHANKHKLNHHDLRQLIRAGISTRKNRVLGIKTDWEVFNDTVWCCFHRRFEHPISKFDANFFFNHASQDKVDVWMNEDCVSDGVLKRRGIKFTESVGHGDWPEDDEFDDEMDCEEEICEMDEMQNPSDEQVLRKFERMLENYKEKGRDRFA